MASLETENETVRYLFETASNYELVCRTGSPRTFLQTITTFPLQRLEFVIRAGIFVVIAMSLSLWGSFPQNNSMASYLGLFYIILAICIPPRSVFCGILFMIDFGVIISFCCISLILCIGIATPDNYALTTMYIAFCFLSLWIGQLKSGKLNSMTMICTSAVLFFAISVLYSTLEIGVKGISITFSASEILTFVDGKSIAQIEKFFAPIEAKTGIKFVEFIAAYGPQIINAIKTSTAFSAVVVGTSPPLNISAGQFGVTFFYIKDYWMLRMLWQTEKQSMILNMVIVLFVGNALWLASLWLPPYRTLSRDISESWVNDLKLYVAGLRRLRFELTSVKENVVRRNLFSVPACSSTDVSHVSLADLIILCDSLVDRAKKNCKLCPLLSMELTLIRPDLSVDISKDMATTSTLILESFFFFRRVLVSSESMFKEIGKISSTEFIEIQQWEKSLEMASYVLLETESLFLELIPVLNNFPRVSCDANFDIVLSNAKDKVHVILSKIHDSVVEYGQGLKGDYGMTLSPSNPLNSDANALSSATFSFILSMSKLCTFISKDLSSSIFIMAEAHHKKSVKNIFKRLIMILVPMIVLFARHIQILIIALWPFPTLKQRPWRDVYVLYGFRYSCMMMIVVAPAFFNSSYRGITLVDTLSHSQRVLLNNGYLDTSFAAWVVLAANICLFATIEGTIQKSVLRVLGSTLGAIVGYIGVRIVQYNSYGLVAWTACYAILLIFFAANPEQPNMGMHPQWGYVFQVSIWTQLIIAMDSAKGTFTVEELALERGIAMALGSFIAVLCSYLLWPIVAESTVRNCFAAHSRNLKRCISDLMDVYLPLNPTIFSSNKTSEGTDVVEMQELIVNVSSSVSDSPSQDTKDDLAIHFSTVEISQDALKLANLCIADGRLFPFAKTISVAFETETILHLFYVCLHMFETIPASILSSQSNFQLTNEEARFGKRHPFSIVGDEDSTLVADAVGVAVSDLHFIRSARQSIRCFITSLFSFSSVVMTEISRTGISIHHFGNPLTTPSVVDSYQADCDITSAHASCARECEAAWTTVMTAYSAISHHCKMTGRSFPYLSRMRLYFLLSSFQQMSNTILEIGKVANRWEGNKVY